ncbi:unnamed protein product [Cylindrotheca closterium]|uniref:Uncharacterized protein n=1 Tax=Cylindrotheca closterium TaxID=2856 RepID=A0AAD2FPF8_9STRA|nr:unnamed protein product [Cylindrotheca closterium]
MNPLSQRDYLNEVKEIDFHFRIVACSIIVVWLTLIGVSYTFAPKESLEVLDGPELYAAFFSASFLGFSLLARFFQLLWLESKPNNARMSGVLWASLAVQTVAMSTNALMACGIPIPVMMDPVLNTRVFLLRWCEWTCLSFCMTFVVAGVDPASGIKTGYVIGASQSLSTVCGLIFPFCQTVESWTVWMIISCVLWCGIFVALFQQKKSFGKMEKGCSAHSVELWDRANLSYKLMMTCSIAWSTLVLMYFFAGAAAFYRPPGVPDSQLPIFQRTYFIMLWEATMDVVLKNLYMDIIVQVHKVAFDDSERAERRLAELRQQMSAIWERSSDAICVSVQGIGGAITTMVSPAYLREFHGISSKPKAIVFEVDEKHIRRKNYSKLQVRTVREINFPVLPTSGSKVFRKNTEGKDSNLSNSSKNNNRHRSNNNVSVGATDETAAGEFGLGTMEIDVDESLLTSLAGMVGRAWNQKTGSRSMNHRLLKIADGAKVFIKCEANICTLDNDAMLMVVRDISERTKRFEAEKKTILETTARKKDAEANRFTRHEVKNGLLAAIDLCESLKESTFAVGGGHGSGNGQPRVQDGQLARAGTTSQLSSAVASSRAVLANLNSEASAGDRDQSPNNQNIAVYTEELDKTLKTILDTILSEAMARDVIHGNYEPKLERVELKQLLHASETMHDQFSLQVSPSPMPSLHLDPQLLLYIHRNAVSNACKYGRVNGPVTTKVSYDESTQLLQMEVVNLPGPEHEALLKLGSSAPAQVFAPGQRLHQKESSHSAGDGAWIMQKCAETLRGNVDIRFESDMTVFTLVCPAKKFELSVKSEHFQIPKNAWGVAIDDSKIQRKLLSRFLSHAGVAESRQIVKGYTTEEIESFDSFLVDLVERNPNDYFLVVADENLDITENGTLKVTVSGSECIQKVRQRLDPTLEARMLSLVRSANDSSQDIATYLSRAHGFIPKAPVRSSSVVEAIAPLWEQRFNYLPTRASPTTCAAVPDLNSGGAAISDFLSLVVQELLANLDAVDELCSEESDSSLKENWPFVWEKLHCLKGDLSSLFNTPSIEQAVVEINSMRGAELPVDFEVRWGALRSRISDIASTIGGKKLDEESSVPVGIARKRSISESCLTTSTPTTSKKLRAS